MAKPTLSILATFSSFSRFPQKAHVISEKPRTRHCRSPAENPYVLKTNFVVFTKTTRKVSISLMFGCIILALPRRFSDTCENPGLWPPCLAVPASGSTVWTLFGALFGH